MERTLDMHAPSGRFEERRLVIVLVDLAGFTRAVGHLPVLAIAEIVDWLYTLCGDRVPLYGGRIVHFMGDGFLAVFESESAADAVACVVSLRDDVQTMAVASGLAVEMGANVHLATVATGVFGAMSVPTDDVIGMGVIHTNRMGGGAGIRISEPVYRKLPSDQRTPWRKHQPPATYTLEP